MPVSQPKTESRIFLIRHGRPLVSRAGWFSLSAARQFISDYDAAAVEEFDRTLADIRFEPLPNIYCSTLERSRDTARKLFGSEAQITEDALFREFERKVLALPFLKMPIGWWIRLTRFLWFLGIRSRSIESFAQARQRARKAAAFLVTEAQQNGQVVLVAHGMLNYFIGRSLKQQGWKNLRKSSGNYLGIAEWVSLKD